MEIIEATLRGLVMESIGRGVPNKEGRNMLRRHSAMLCDRQRRQWKEASRSLN